MGKQFALLVYPEAGKMGIRKRRDLLMGIFFLTPPFTTATGLGLEGAIHHWSARRGGARRLSFLSGMTCDGRNRRAADPYGRSCGGRELKPPAYLIRHFGIVFAMGFRPIALAAQRPRIEKI